MTLSQPIEHITAAPNAASPPGARLRGNPTGGQTWTPELDEKLRALHSTHCVKDLAAVVGRSASAVRSHLRSLGITPIPDPCHWTRAENWKLYSLAEKYGAEDIARIMRRPLGTIKKKLTQQKIRTLTDMYSLKRASEETGYCRIQLRRAKDALGQAWAVHGGKVYPRYRITPRQLDELCEWLKKEK